MFLHQIKYLKRAVEIEPDKGFSKYMTLGELLEGQHAVEYLKKGVELMINEKKCLEKVHIYRSTDDVCYDHKRIHDQLSKQRVNCFEMHVVFILTS